MTLHEPKVFRRQRPITEALIPDAVLPPAPYAEHDGRSLESAQALEALREGLEKTFEDYADQARRRRDWVAASVFQLAANVARFYGLRHVPSHTVYQSGVKETPSKGSR